MKKLLSTKEIIEFLGFLNVFQEYEK